MLETELTIPPVEARPPARAPHVITRKAVAGWVLFDLANVIFSMGVLSLYFSLWVRGEVGAARADRVYTMISAASMAVIFVMSPLLGAMTDRARRRMPFLVASSVITAVFTAFLARTGFWTTAVCFVVANAAYQAGVQFYDALLPEVTTEQNRGKIGGIGVGVGYLGSFLAVGLGTKALLGTADMPRLFSAIALCFLAFAVPCFAWVRERGNPSPRPIDLRMVRESTRETIATLRSGSKYPGLVRFLVGRVFYTDAINTVINVMTLFAVNVARSTSNMTEAQAKQAALRVMLSAIVFAVGGGFFWGWITDRRGPRRALNLVLQAWMAVFVAAAVIGIVGLPIVALYVVGAAAGFSLGGVWAADRTYMLRLAPPSRIGEFYGLYGMVGRFAAITGPAVWALVTYVTNERMGMVPRIGEGIAVIFLLGMVILGYTILQPVSDAPREWAEDELR